MSKIITEEAILEHLRNNPDELRGHDLDDCEKSTVTLKIDGILCAFTERTLKEMHKKATKSK